MPEAATTFEVREVSDGACVIDITGDITAASEDVLMDAYGRASDAGVRAIVLSFTGLDYMNSGGIGLLVTLLVRAQRQRQRVLAYGLSDHYRQIFELTRLDEAVGIHDSEAERPGRGAAMRGEESWAKSVSRLEVTDVPDGAVNLNVEGRRLTSPIQGFGKMWQKTYQVRLPAERVSATELIAAWKENFPEFWPEGNPSTAR